MSEQPQPSESRRNWPKSLAEMTDVVESVFIRSGIENDRATELAEMAMKELGQYFGGRIFYLPRGDKILTALRNRKLYKDWSRGGVSVPELADIYGITGIHVYKIIRQQRSLRKATEATQDT